MKEDERYREIERREQSVQMGTILKMFVIVIRLLDIHVNHHLAPHYFGVGVKIGNSRSQSSRFDGRKSRLSCRE